MHCATCLRQYPLAAAPAGINRWACKVLFQLALAVITMSVLGFKVRAQARSCEEFEQRMRFAAQSAILNDPGPPSGDPYDLAQHKRELAKKIVESVRSTAGDEGNTMGDLGYLYGAVTWKLQIKQGFEGVFHLNLRRGGNCEHTVDGTYAFTYNRPACSPIAGLGSPCISGRAVYTKEQLNQRQGAEMACMVFYMPAYSMARWHIGFGRASIFFQASVDHCCGARPADGDYALRAWDVRQGLVGNIDLGALAECVFNDYRSERRQGRRDPRLIIRLRGVAAVPGYRHPGVAQLLHEDFGQFAPEGFLLMSYFVITLPDRRAVAVHFFSVASSRA